MIKWKQIVGNNDNTALSNAPLRVLTTGSLHISNFIQHSVPLLRRMVSFISVKINLIQLQKPPATEVRNRGNSFICPSPIFIYRDRSRWHFPYDVDGAPKKAEHLSQCVSMVAIPMKGRRCRRGKVGTTDAAKLRNRLVVRLYGTGRAQHRAESTKFRNRACVGQENVVAEDLRVTKN